MWIFDHSFPPLGRLVLGSQLVDIQLDFALDGIRLILIIVHHVLNYSNHVGEGSSVRAGESGTAPPHKFTYGAKRNSRSFQHKAGGNNQQNNTTSKYQTHQNSGWEEHSSPDVVHNGAASTQSSVAMSVPGRYHLGHLQPMATTWNTKAAAWQMGGGAGATNDFEMQSTMGGASTIGGVSTIPAASSVHMQPHL